MIYSCTHKQTMWLQICLTNWRRMIMTEEDGLLPSSFSLFIHHSCSIFFEFGPIQTKVLNPKNPPHWFWLMGVVLRRHHRRFIPTLTIFALLLLLSSSSASSLNNFSKNLIILINPWSDISLDKKSIYHSFYDLTSVAIANSPMQMFCCLI